MTFSFTRDLLRDNRGLSMTEGVIVIPFFLIVWMGFITLHSVYQGALTAQVAAQNLALGQAAIGECEGAVADQGSNPEMDEALAGTGASGSVGGTSVDAIVLIEESGGASLFDWSHHVIGASAEAGGIPEAWGGPTQTMGGGAKVMCNMEPRDGLGDMIYGFLQDLF